MQTRKLGPFDVSAIGFGCMSLSHAYGSPPPAEEAAKVLLGALDLGFTFLDTAALYGFGANETLLGNTLRGRRSEYVLASKCGMTGVDGVRVIDGRPETIKATCEQSLARLQTDVIDLYYLHRWDRNVPIEDSVGALADLVTAGKIRAIGLSEVSAATLRRAHAVHPVTAIQSEYSLWTRNPELGMLDACRELGVGFVAFSPVARAFLTGKLTDPDRFEPRDIRRGMPRFQGENWQANLRLLAPYEALAAEAGCTPAQLALAWLLAQGEFIIPIPGTTRLDHLAEDAGGASVSVSPDLLARAGALISPATVAGDRYNEATYAEIDTERA